MLHSNQNYLSSLQYHHLNQNSSHCKSKKWVILQKKTKRNTKSNLTLHHFIVRFFTIYFIQFIIRTGYGKTVMQTKQNFIIKHWAWFFRHNQQWEWCTKDKILLSADWLESQNLSAFSARKTFSERQKIGLQNPKPASSVSSMTWKTDNFLPHCQMQPHELLLQCFFQM